MAEETSAQKKAAPGWYARKDQSDRLGYWTGAHWAEVVEVAERERHGRISGWSPDAHIAIGIVVAIIGGAVIGYGLSTEDGQGPLFVGALLALLGQVELGVGIIAKGVQIGYRWRLED